MRVFLTGATGLVGSAIIPQLLARGHSVLGLARSEAGEKFLRSAGADVHLGRLEDLKSIHAGVAMADAVIHCAFEHDFSRFKESAELDKRVIETFGDVLEGTDRPLLVSTGMPLESHVRPITERVELPDISPTPRVSEQTAISLQTRGVHVNVIRLPQVHSVAKQGLVTSLIGIAREKGVSTYVDDGSNRWSACYVQDAARVYALALDRHEAGATYHAVSEEGVTLKAIAEAIGDGLNVPISSIPSEDADAHFGFFGRLVQRDLSASSAITRQLLGWDPTGPGLIENIVRHLKK
ncbi:NAD-dependent dehydratase [Bordetella genomosp. 10]|uniref:NAD-dependent dehydratase n=1 Tax=Bordetella genomosp. 10 TaxID=1416804 RepID=A0A261S2K5_9BORD|nr:SDR family oxidoreductase [Bordetella genomosp. 10]OZI31415.1 NAD-dependent dehydratase [Bordetella genomosp. 10]